MEIDVSRRVVIDILAGEKIVPLGTNVVYVSSHL